MYCHELDPASLSIQSLGLPRWPSPLRARYYDYTAISYYAEVTDIERCFRHDQPLPAFEAAGPRSQLFFNPADTRCGIVSCGGLCPGINDVIRAIVYEAYLRYGVREVLGFRYGYRGMDQANTIAAVSLTTDAVMDIHEKGGSMLSASRGGLSAPAVVDTLEQMGISILFTIGGDGTLRGAAAICDEIARRDLPIAVVGVPKTIDNDICFVERTFGFDTAVEASRSVLQSAHVEAKGHENGVGLVKLMGRDSGFIAAQATIANADVNFCLVPEIAFALEGERGLFAQLERRLARRQHAVIVVAEGAGQDLIAAESLFEPEVDASGNVLKQDIGRFLKDKIAAYFAGRQIPMTIKYIDPSYIIRSQRANAADSLFCLQLGQHALHAGMAGRTRMLVGYWNHNFTHVPIDLATRQRKKLDPEGRLWQTVLSTLG